MPVIMSRPLTNRERFLIFPFALLAFGSVFIYSCYLLFFSWRATHAWIPTPAILELPSQTTGFFPPVMDYRYRFAGQVYIGHTRSYQEAGCIQHGTRSHSYDCLPRVGYQVTVSVDPPAS